MARARIIKPGFFKNEDLLEIPFEGRLLFVGLWTLADREGRLEDRPKKIKMEIFPCDDVSINKLLDELSLKKFIQRYEVQGKNYIQIVNFLKHQKPHARELDSEIPPISGKAQPRPDPSTTQAGPEHNPGNGQAALDPSSLDPGSGVHDPLSLPSGKNNGKFSCSSPKITKWINSHDGFYNIDRKAIDVLFETRNEADILTGLRRTAAWASDKTDIKGIAMSLNKIMDDVPKTEDPDENAWGPGKRFPDEQDYILWLKSPRLWREAHDLPRL